MNSQRISAAVILACVSLMALSEERALESILVTAHAPVPKNKSYLETLDVITESDIRRQVDLHQLLNGVEGVYASREGGPGGVNSLSIRGAEPNFTVVLIDGVAVNDPTNSRGGSFDLSTLSLAQIRRVELIKGPGSLAYGSDALAGVVRILTAPQQNDKSGLSLAHEAQEYGAARSSASATLSSAAHSFSVQGARADSGDAWPGSELELSEAAVHYRFTLDRASFQLGGRDADFDKRSYPEQSGGPQYAQNDSRDRSKGRDQTRYLSGDLSIVDDWRLAAQISEFKHDLDYYSPGIAPYNNVPENYYVADYSRQQWRIVNEVKVGSFNFNVGADRRWEEGVSDGAVNFANVPVDALGFLLGLPSPPVETGLTLPIAILLDTDYSLRRTTQGRFAELNWQSMESLVLSAGLRRDTIDGEHETVRRYLIGLPVQDWLRVNLSYSEGFKSPSFFALGHGLVGNPNLKPERVSSFQLDSAAEFEWGSIELSLFDTEYRDLIDFDSEAFTNVNRNLVESRGGELSASLRLAAWTLGGSVSHVNIEIENSDRKLANRPHNIASLELNWQYSKHLSLQNRVRWVDQQFATSLHSGQTREYVLDDYALWDAVARWEASASLAFTLGLENLADASYQEAVGFPGAGRILRLSVAINL
ncbi:MAG: vitamin B12 transporter [Paracoccaceae bacterium]